MGEPHAKRRKVVAPTTLGECLLLHVPVTEVARLIEDFLLPISFHGLETSNAFAVVLQTKDPDAFALRYDIMGWISMCLDHIPELWDNMRHGEEVYLLSGVLGRKAPDKLVVCVKIHRMISLKELLVHPPQTLSTRALVASLNSAVHPKTVTSVGVSALGADVLEKLWKNLMNRNYHEFHDYRPSGFSGRLKPLYYAAAARQWRSATLSRANIAWDDRDDQVEW